MNKSTLIIFVIGLILISLTILPIPNTSATSGIMADFSNLYGSEMSSKYSCDICHISGGTSLNEYGKDLSDSGGGGCADYNPPAGHSHLEIRGTCDAYHEEGYQNPLTSTCTGCHGSDLRGGNAPSCYTCHDKLWGDDGNGRCPDFDPPASHSIYESDDGCGAYHAPGFKDPLQNGCNSCHGSNLRGDTGPSCYTCHGNEWDDDDDAPPAMASSIHASTINADAFKSIENVDSDGDGYSNIEEINAVSNPGDSKSIPGVAFSADVSMDTTWNNDWAIKKGSFKVTIKTTGGKVDATRPITLSNGKLNLSTTNIKGINQSSVKATFNKGLLYTLFADANTKVNTVTVSGYSEEGAAFQVETNVTLTGKEPEMLSNLNPKTKPKTLDTSKDLDFSIRGKDISDINLNATIYAVGNAGQVALKQIAMKKSSLVATIPAKSLAKIAGAVAEGNLYTLGLRGKGSASNTFFAVSVTLKGVKGSGADDCLKFSSPASHTVKLTAGNCTYLHAAGFNDPLNNGCATCHGTNLKGSSIAPSCTQCHIKNW